jgi:hypothetical protein
VLWFHLMEKHTDTVIRWSKIVSATWRCLWLWFWWCSKNQDHFWGICTNVKNMETSVQIVLRTGKPRRLTWRAWLAVALVAIHQVDAAPFIQAGAAVTLVDLVTTDGSHVAGVAQAGVGINAVLALAVVARIRVTVVHIFLTQHTSESWGKSFAKEASEPKQKLCPGTQGHSSALHGAGLEQWLLLALNTGNWLFALSYNRHLESCAHTKDPGSHLQSWGALWPSTRFAGEMRIPDSLLTGNQNKPLSTFPLYLLLSEYLSS